MVVISAAILSKTGKTLVARQFVEITRGRIEGLLAAFPKLLLSDAEQKREHTFLETPSVRYVYQPMEDLYMLIITNKSSNILEDLDALHLLAKIVGDYCRRLSEEEVLEAAFDLIFAFDEVFASGYKEKLTLHQIEENLEMDSHNERIAEIMQRNQQIEAQQKADEIAVRLEQERRIARARGLAVGGGSSGRSMSSSDHYAATSSGGSTTSNSPATSSFAQKKPSRGTSSSSGGSGVGMKLGSKVKTSANDAFLQALAKEDTSVELQQQSAAHAGGAGAVGGAGMAAAQQETKAVHFIFAEKVSATMDKEGEVSAVDVRGELNLLITDARFQRIQVQLNAQDKNFSFKTHPALHKGAFKKNVLALKDPETKPFPLNRREPALKWRLKSRDDPDMAPLTVECWPSKGNQETTVVNMTYELQDVERTLHNVRIEIPIQARVTPVVQSASGDYQFDAKQRTLNWIIPIVNEDSNEGALEFVVADLPGADSLFPINIAFTSEDTICGLNAVEVRALGDETPAEFSTERSLQTERYEVALE